ncbi:MAG: hypothetical protein PHX72_00255 [Candidatus Shapirobacteria bacterium]|nr:hypothetical protein [Candidatus Shapirobacteria bacterium]
MKETAKLINFLSAATIAFSVGTASDVGKAKAQESPPPSGRNVCINIDEAGVEPSQGYEGVCRVGFGVADGDLEECKDSLVTKTGIPMRASMIPISSVDQVCLPEKQVQQKDVPESESVSEATVWNLPNGDTLLCQEKIDPQISNCAGHEPLSIVENTSDPRFSSGDYLCDQEGAWNGPCQQLEEAQEVTPPEPVVDPALPIGTPVSVSNVPGRQETRRTIAGQWSRSFKEWSEKTAPYKGMLSACGLSLVGVSLLLLASIKNSQKEAEIEKRQMREQRIEDLTGVFFGRIRKELSDITGDRDFGKGCLGLVREEAEILARRAEGRYTPKELFESMREAGINSPITGLADKILAQKDSSSKDGSVSGRKRGVYGVGDGTLKGIVEDLTDSGLSRRTVSLFGSRGPRDKQQVMMVYHNQETGEKKVVKDEIGDR